MTLNIEKVDNFPEISRSGRVSEELNAIIAALNDSVLTGNKFCIKDVQRGKAYNSMQQRVRAQAKKLGYHIVIRFDALENSLYFKASIVSMKEPRITSKDFVGVKVKEKVLAS